MSSEISKQEYLKRYLEKEKDSDRKRKKKPKKKPQIPSLKIINEDIDLKSIDFGEVKEEEEEVDEAPVVAEIIDERPVEVKVKEQYHSSRWKKIDDEDSLSNSVKENESKKPNLGSSFLVEKSLSEKNYAKNDKNNLKRSRHDSDSDLSPPRHPEKVKRKENNSYNQSSKRNRHDSGSYISPPRSQEQSKSRHDSDSDISPPRHNLNKSYNKQKSNRYNSDSDLSPPRSKLSKTTASSRQKAKRHDSDSDLSPPRHKLSKSAVESPQKSKHHGSDSDLSPPRHRNSDSLQRNRRSKRTNSDSDISPPRHRASHKSNSLTKSSSGKHNSDSDQASSKNYNQLPERRKPDGEYKQKWDKSGYRSVSPSTSESLAKDKSKKLDKTLSGLKAGLQNSKTLQVEVQELRERERNQLNILGDEISGRNAGTIVRDRKTGLKRDLNQEQEKKKEEDMKTKEYQKKYAVWGKGIEQQVDKVEQFKDDIYEMSKPLARYRDDEDLDERLKSIIREDDPMAEYIKKKKQKDTPSFPVYKGPPAPPNRFGIQPGYRWDGVDRSNGFEKKYFEKINKSKAIETEAYLWSVQDM